MKGSPGKGSARLARAKRALARGRAGQVLSGETHIPRRELKAIPGAPRWESRRGPRAVRDTEYARKHLAREPGEPASFCHALGSGCCRAHQKAPGRAAMSQRPGKSDACAVPKKLPNKAVGEPSAAAPVAETLREQRDWMAVGSCDESRHAHCPLPRTPGGEFTLAGCRNHPHSIVVE
jgi:hypothetical protein